MEAKAKSDQLATHLHTPSPRLRKRRHRQQPSLQTPATRTSRTPRMQDNKTCVQIHAIYSKPKNAPQHTTNPPPSGVETAAALPSPVGTTTITCTDLEAADRARVCDVELSDRLTGEDWGRASPLRRTASVAAVTGTAARVLPDGAWCNRPAMVWDTAGTRPTSVAGPAAGGEAPTHSSPPYVWRERHTHTQAGRQAAMSGEARQGQMWRGKVHPQLPLPSSPHTQRCAAHSLQ